MKGYKGSLKRYERLTKFALWVIALLFGLFLILLGNLVLSDMDQWFRAPDYEEFVDQNEIVRLEALEESIDRKIYPLKEDLESYKKALESARRKYESEKKSLDNWIETRKAVGAGNDQVVINRARALDDYRKAEEEWQDRISAINAEITRLQKQKEAYSREKGRVFRENQKKYDRRLRLYQVKIFLIRLAFVMPVLGLGIFFFVRLRKHRLWPLVWGYIFFSLYAFFIGLVPYLPDYGGYIRYPVGIILTGFIGYYAIRELARYTERKRRELEESSEERARKIGQDTAIKAYQSHSCPSCERDFLMHRINPASKSIRESSLNEDGPEFCSHCGLRLFGPCPSCGNRNFVHFIHCSACGAGLHGND